MKEKYTRLEKVIENKDKALQQKQMVLKFRQETIKKLEKSMKEQEGYNPDDKDTIIVRKSINVKYICGLDSRRKPPKIKSVQLVYN